MAVGRTPPPKTDVDNQASSLLISLNNTLGQIAAFKAWLDTQLDTDLTSMGYTAGDVSNLRSAYNDAGALQSVWIGTGTLTPARDLRTFARRIWGTGL